MHRLAKNKLLYIVFSAGTILGVAVAVGVYYLFFNNGLDADMQKVLKQIPDITSYVQQVQTQTSYSGRKLQIDGVYEVDSKNSDYAAYSTTTLFISGDSKPHTFAYDDIALGSDIYVMVTTTDAFLLRNSLQIPNWKHFTIETIPNDYADLAIDGPVEDTLQILGDNGAYLKLLKQNGSHYTFALSGVTPHAQGGTLPALFSLIATGTIDVWIDPHTAMVTQMVFTNYPFISTSTISRINAPLPISAPARSN